MLIPLLIILMMVSQSTSEQHSEDAPYCALRYRRLCQGKGRHIGCQFPSAGPGESCQNFTKIKFDNDLRHFIIHYINRRRQRLAAGTERLRGGAHVPKPQIMLQVAWDRELAHLAQRLANQCNFVHDDCRATVRYPYAGQTVGEVKWRRSSESDTQSAQRAIRRIFDAWWGEKRRVQPKHLIQPFRITNKGNAWGHFTQLAVWNLCAVGCGAVRHVDKYPRLLLVCDFSHTNMLGQKTINPGPLAKCPLHMTRRPRSPYPLLCVPVRQTPTNAQQTDQSQDYYADEDYEDPSEEYVNEDDTTSSTEGDMSVHGLRDPLYNVTEVRGRVVESERADIQSDDEVVLSIKPKSEKDRAKYNLMRQKKKKGHRPTTDSRAVYFRKNEERYDEGVTTRPQTNDNFEDSASNENVENKFNNVNKELFNKSNRQQWRSSSRWSQHQKGRPDRPGAKALLINSSPLDDRFRVKSLPQETVGTLKMDEEDIDQLFKDTGFKPDWRDKKQTA